MRQQNHQKSRGRGRGRKPQNPMSRNFESNGPDVKIRGNAAHIAEKYSTLARDALSNGDRVIAENYLQHAEHYNRIVAAAQAQQAQQRSERQENETEANNDQVKAETDQSEQTSDVSAENAPQPHAKPNKRANGRSRSPKPVEAEAIDEVSDNADEEAPKRKTTRGRRPKIVDDEADASVEVSDNLASEVISDDAAKLPDSITGGMVSEEG